MKYVDEFRDAGLARQLSAALHHEAQPDRAYRFMEFCGGHTHAISRYGIIDLLPPSITMIHGPGCPVCVLPAGRIADAVTLAEQAGVILCTYGDTLRVPGADGLSLLQAKAQGCDIRMVYSTLDALRLAEEYPEREVIFFAIGFETTTPPTALAVQQAAARGLGNFSVFCNHVLTPAAMHAILKTNDSEGADETVQLDGFIGPAHVSTVIGYRAYEPFPAQYGKPVVVSGFEPLDVMQSILMLVRQINEGRCEIENQFTRAVDRAGNLRAQAVMEEVFEVRESFEWRGLGAVPISGLQLKARYRAFDAEYRFGLIPADVPDHKACDCAAILRGVKWPVDCTLFGRACTPETPMGACMVSAEGACAAYFSYGRFRDRQAS